MFVLKLLIFLLLLLGIEDVRTPCRGIRNTTFWVWISEKLCCEKLRNTSNNPTELIGIRVQNNWQFWETFLEKCDNTLNLCNKRIAIQDWNSRYFVYYLENMRISIKKEIKFHIQVIVDKKILLLQKGVGQQNSMEEISNK